MTLWAKGLFALTILTSSNLCPPPSTKVPQNFAFEWETKSPGNLIAFKLTRNAKFGYLCTRGQCFKATHSWSLLATPLGSEGNLGILLGFESEKWALQSFTLEKSIFNRLPSHMSHLRLPSSVVIEIEKEEDLISSGQFKDKDQDLFKINSDHPWSSHWRFPIKAVATSPFGSPRVPPGGKPYTHNGVDLRAPLKTPVHSCSDGVVVDASFDPIYGNVVTIDHGHGLLSRYMHLSEFRVKPEEIIKTGDIIGLSGTTGRSEAPHLHWEMRYLGKPIDPMKASHLLEHLAYLE